MFKSGGGVGKMLEVSGGRWCGRLAERLKVKRCESRRRRLSVMGSLTYFEVSFLPGKLVYSPHK